MRASKRDLIQLLKRPVSILFCSNFGLIGCKKKGGNLSSDGVRWAVKGSEVLSRDVSGAGILTRVAHTAVWRHLYSTSSRDRNRSFDQRKIPLHLFTTGFQKTGICALIINRALWVQFSCLQTDTGSTRAKIIPPASQNL